MPGLNIIVAGSEGGRLYSALETAMAAAALGHDVRVFLQGEAVAALRDPPVGFPGDDARRAAGQPDLAGLVTETAAMKITLVACQSGMALVGVNAAELPPHVRAGGLISFMANIGPDDRLIVY